MNLPVAILAGGLATRLQPITETIPKSLVTVAGKPFLEHQLNLLLMNGLKKAILCVGYLGEKIQEAIGDGSRFGMQVEYSFDGPVQLGTAGALKKALPLLGEAFFVLYGDSYLEIDYLAVQAAFRQSGKSGLMTVYRNRGRWDQSNVLVKTGLIVQYEKKNPVPGMEYIDYGLSILSAGIFAEMPDGQPGDLADLYTELAARKELIAWEATRRFYEVGSPRGLEEMDRYLSK